MSRSLTNLRRVLFGVSCTVVFGFGATEAFAERAGRSVSLCGYGDPGADSICSMDCSRESESETPYGWCEETGVCKCSTSPKGMVVVIDP
jgi:hypothetical protein